MMIGPPGVSIMPRDAGVQRRHNNQVVTSMVPNAVILFSLLISMDLPLPRSDLITIPLKPSRARVVAEEGFGDSNHRNNRRHPGDDRRVKVVRR